MVDITLVLLASYLWSDQPDIEPIILELFSTRKTLCAVFSCVQYKNDVKLLI